MPGPTRTVAVVGSTGSIGTQALDVLEDAGDRFEVTAIGANSSFELLARQAARFRPKVVALADDTLAPQLEELLPDGVELRSGEGCLGSLVDEAEIVLNSVVGFAGLPVTLETLRQGKRLALANKESLVAGGPLVARVRNLGGGEILPVDSEHGALHQCLRSETPTGPGDGGRVAKLVITASGGPFRGRSIEQLADVTVEDALKHPTWAMGPKITIDSSTLFNKGLEVIEAHELFGIDYDRIDVVVHPQSIIHSAVEFTDGSTIAQMSVPNMQLPIGYALGHPDRLTTPYGALDWKSLSTSGGLTFESPDVDTFRALQLAYDAGRTGRCAPAWLNAANEVAVAAFLEHRVTWVQISSIIERVLDQFDGSHPEDVDAVVAADHHARSLAAAVVEAVQ